MASSSFKTYFFPKNQNFVERERENPLKYSIFSKWKIWKEIHTSETLSNFLNLHESHCKSKETNHWAIIQVKCSNIAKKKIVDSTSTLGSTNKRLGDAASLSANNENMFYTTHHRPSIMQFAEKKLQRETEREREIPTSSVWKFPDQPPHYTTCLISELKHRVLVWCLKRIPFEMERLSTNIENLCCHKLSIMQSCSLLWSSKETTEKL